MLATFAIINNDLVMMSLLFLPFDKLMVACSRPLIINMPPSLESLKVLPGGYAPTENGHV